MKYLDYSEFDIVEMLCTNEEEQKTKLLSLVIDVYEDKVVFKDILSSTGMGFGQKQYR